jgi:hypothetical protein
MPRHQDKDTSFEIPKDWVDKTIVAFAAPTEKARDAAPNFVMAREVIREGDSLRSHADRQLLDLGRHLKDFDLLESKETVCGGQPAVFLRYTWMGHFGRLEQTVTIVERFMEQGRMATSFTTTAPAEDASKTRPVFDELIRTIKFDGAQGPPTGGGAPPPMSGRSSQVPDPAAPVVPMPGYRGGRR